MMFAAALLFTCYYPLHWRLRPDLRKPAFVGLGLVLLALSDGRALFVLAGLTVAVRALLAIPGPGALLAAGLALGSLVVPRAVGILHGEAMGTVLGLSYLAFRLIAAAVEVASGRQAAPGWMAFLTYALFPPALVSGPIHRYPLVAGEARPALATTHHSLRRITTGLLLKILLADPLLASADLPLTPPFGGSFDAWFALACYAGGLYLDFVAYSEMAIGGAALFGFQLPENFDRPLLATDISDFWRRWHMSLGTWLRDYLFLPLSTWLGGIPWLAPHPALIAGLSSLATMTLCGLWHGSGLGFVLWGAGHGVMLALHQAWRLHGIGKLPARRRKLLVSHAGYRLVGWVLTQVPVLLLWVLFRSTPSEAANLYRRLFGLG